MILNLNDYAISRPILVKGVHEASVTKVFKQYMKPNLRFIDIGANLGYYSLLVASQCPNSKIYSFEPDLKNFQLFSSSITYNQFQDRIQAYCLAVGSENKIITISDLGNNSNSGARFTGDNKEVLRPYIHGENPYFREVEAVQLDSFLPDFKIDLVKIDIEGYEPFAIQGMFNIIKQNKPIIFLEFAPSNLKNIGLTEPEKFLQIFTDMEYNINIINKQGDTISYGREITQFFRDFFQYKVHHLDLLLLPT
ncbi:MAG: FkbM family methyltransferase [Leptolyngbya sp.]|nr:MAG: FkbM family methyltransferase [Leptolyngbya sp.]